MISLKDNGMGMFFNCCGVCTQVDLATFCGFGAVSDPADAGRFIEAEAFGGVGA